MRYMINMYTAHRNRIWHLDFTEYQLVLWLLKGRTAMTMKNSTEFKEKKAQNQGAKKS